MAEEVRPDSWRASFHPDTDPGIQDMMRREFVAARRTMGEHSLAVCAEIAPDETRRATGNDIREALTAEPDGEDSLFVDPVFATWMHFLNRAVARRDAEEVRYHCSRIGPVMKRVVNRLGGHEPNYVRRTKIAVQQDDIDPYVMAATPPSYDFKAVLTSKEGRNGHGHPLPMQQELVSIALENIEAAWPDLRAQIEDVVQIIGYLPDATFRSCSAMRYAGVVYLGNLDEHLLDIEESIVHEAGHQVLYRLGELVPLVHEDTPQTEDYTLPWSGSKRDLFGFLHAFYIYTLLTKYFWRRSKLNERERRDCIVRALFILIGSAKAIPMLLGDKNLSSQGRQLVEVIAEDMEALSPELEGAWKEIAADHG